MHWVSGRIARGSSLLKPTVSSIKAGISMFIWRLLSKKHSRRSSALLVVCHSLFRAKAPARLHVRSCRHASENNMHSAPKVPARCFLLSNYTSGNLGQNRRTLRKTTVRLGPPLHWGLKASQNQEKLSQNQLRIDCTRNPRRAIRTWWKPSLYWSMNHACSNSYPTSNRKKIGRQHRYRQRVIEEMPNYGRLKFRGQLG
jgi:hypothetical protein